MQLHGLAVYILHSVHHILDKLSIRCSRGMHTHHYLRLLGLFLVSTLGLHFFAVAIDCILAYLICSHNGRCQELVQAGGKRFTTCRIADNKRRAIKASQLRGAMIEPIRASRHQRHH